MVAVMEFGRWLTMNEPRWSLACSYPNPHPSSLNLNSPHLVEHHYLSPQPLDPNPSLAIFGQFNTQHLPQTIDPPPANLSDSAHSSGKSKWILSLLHLQHTPRTVPVSVLALGPPCNPDRRNAPYRPQQALRRCFIFLRQ